MRTGSGLRSARRCPFDTHKDTHVVAVIDSIGRLIATDAFRTTTRGYGELYGWLVHNGPISLVGIEGTGSYGVGIAALLTGHGIDVVEVNRPDRQLRRRHGKTDTIDAEAAARSALNGHASGLAKSHDGIVESIRAALTDADDAAQEPHRVDQHSAVGAGYSPCRNP